jgi:hypothetical protein
LHIASVCNIYNKEFVWATRKLCGASFYQQAWALPCAGQTSNKWKILTGASIKTAAFY